MYPGEQQEIVHDVLGVECVESRGRLVEKDEAGVCDLGIGGDVDG
jgi:hypothetical protein